MIWTVKIIFDIQKKNWLERQKRVSEISLHHADQGCLYFFQKNTLKWIIFYNTKFYFNIFQKVWKSTIIRSQSWYFLIFQKACWFGAQQTLLSKLCRKESTQKRCSGLTKSKKERKFTNIYFQGKKKAQMPWFFYPYIPNIHLEIFKIKNTDLLLKCPTWPIFVKKKIF